MRVQSFSRPVGVCLLLAWTTAIHADPARPNVVLILADDLGWADVGCNGGDLVRTPHIDALAARGVRFSQAYAPSPVCSPSRAALLTGKSPARLRITVWSEAAAARTPADRKLLPADSLDHLPLAETTLAERLAEAGFLTALVGKWHLGAAAFAPEAQGFDINIGGTHWGAPATFFWPYRGSRFEGEYRYVPHLGFGHPGEYLTDRLTDEALKVIDHAGDRPFFLYLAHHAPHTPIEAKNEDVEFFRARLHPGDHHRNAVYAAMVKSLDDSVGRVVARLSERGLDRNTLLIFASDNGGYIGVDRKSGQDMPVTDNAPLRSGKGSCYEGGLRIPLIVRWPEVTPPGAVCHEPVVLTDLFPTLAGAAGCDTSAKASRDGVDLSGLLRQPGGSLGTRALFFHYPHYYDTTTPVSAVRAGNWKLLEYFEDRHVELYDLGTDPGERTDLAAKQADKANELRGMLQQWRASVGAACPAPNPESRD